MHTHQFLTTGVYAWVRNPIYAAISMSCTGVLYLKQDAWLYLLPFFYWAFLTGLMKQTEEKWMVAHFKEEYRTYCKEVNRCIPWFPKQKIIR